MIYVVIIVVSLGLSFFFSGTETAFVAVNKVRIELWRRSEQRIAKIIWPFIEKPEKFLYTTLIGNNISNVAFASFATLYLNLYMEPHFSWLLMVFLSLILGEIIPKTVFASLADWVVTKIAWPLKWFYHLFQPLIWLISQLSERLLAMMGQQEGELNAFFSRKDIEILLQKSQKTVERHDPIEGQFLEGILKLKSQWVRDAMVPRMSIIAVPTDTTIEELIEVFEETEHTKIPVYGENLDDIVGVVFAKDLFRGLESFAEMVRPVMFVPETKRCSDLLADFRNANSSIAIVIDEYGGTAGLTTPVRLVEELFGDIPDEYDAVQRQIRQIDKDVYRISAQVEIEKFNEELGESLPEGDYETLGGFLINQMGYIPRRDEAFIWKHLHFMITNATRRRVEAVKLMRKDHSSSQ